MTMAFPTSFFKTRAPGKLRSTEMNGKTLVGGGPVNPSPGPAWQAIGAGDFNGDGFSDLLFQNANTGQVSIWEMNGINRIGGGPVSRQSGPKLARGRSGRLQCRRLCRYPFSKHERSNLDLGNEREHDRRRRARRAPIPGRAGTHRCEGGVLNRALDGAAFARLSAKACIPCELIVINDYKPTGMCRQSCLNALPAPDRRA